MRKIVLFVLGSLLATSAFAQETTNKRIICSIKDFSVSFNGKDRIADADNVGLIETPKELIIPEDATETDDGKAILWEGDTVRNLYFPAEKIWHLAYSYLATDKIVSVNAVRVCDEF